MNRYRREKAQHDELWRSGRRRRSGASKGFSPTSAPCWNSRLTRAVPAFGKRCSEATCTFPKTTLRGLGRRISGRYM